MLYMRLMCIEADSPACVRLHAAVLDMEAAERGPVPAYGDRPCLGCVARGIEFAVKM